MSDPLIGELLKETQEQARLLGMSGERECDLRGKIQRLERELAVTKEINTLLQEESQLLKEMVDIYKKIEEIQKN